MSIERLWSGWRAAYVSGAAGGDPPGECLFCELPEQGDAEAYIIERGERTYTVMNLYPYTTGHVVVVPARHESELDGLSPDEGSALFSAMQRALIALKRAYSPEGLNVGANLGRVAGAGVPGHTHLHVLPRWAGDTNFMTTVAETRVLPEDIRTTYEKLLKAWPTP